MMARARALEATGTGRAKARRAGALLLALGMVSPAFAADRSDNFPAVLTISPTGVNLQKGNFTHSKVDLSIGDLVLNRSYGMKSGYQAIGTASFGGTADQMMPGQWLHDYGHAVRTATRSSDRVAYVYVGGDKIAFIYNLSANLWTPDYVSVEGLASFGTQLTYASSRFTFRDRLGNVYTFRPDPVGTNPAATSVLQYIDQIEYADGKVYSFSYNSNGQLRTLRSSLGYALVFDYDSNSRVSTVCGYNSAINNVDTTTTCAGASLKVHYGYDGSGRLTSITDVHNQVRTITYTSNGLPYCLSLPASSTCEIRNDAYGLLPGEPVGAAKETQVRQQTTATGDVWQFSYENEQLDPTWPIPHGQPVITYTHMSGPNGTFADVEYHTGLMHQLQTEFDTKTFEWNGTQMSKINYLYENGRNESLVRDLHQRVTSKTHTPATGFGQSPITVTINYDTPTETGCVNVGPKLCSKPQYRIDERGHRTDFTYDPTHGQILSETGPDLGGGLRAQTRYSYVQRTPWLNNGAGYYYAAPAIWVLAQKSFCKSGFASGSGCANGGDEVVTTYDYGPNSGPNNLLLRGIVEDATGQSLRTCFVYDATGNKIAETKPRALPSSCS